VFVNRVLGRILGTKREKDGENCRTRRFMVSNLLKGGRNEQGIWHLGEKLNA